MPGVSPPVDRLRVIAYRGAMHNALLIGYYGEMNTGDDALLAAAAWGMARHFPQARLYSEIARVPRLIDAAVTPALGRKLFPGHNWLRGQWLRRRLRQVVYGGGSIFFNASTLHYWCRLLDGIGAGAHFAAGVSVGPFASRVDETACAELLRRLAFVGVRDAASLARARACCPEARVELTFDLAPLLAQIDPPAPAAERRGLGVALCHYERYTGGDVAREAARMDAVAAGLDAAARAGAVDELVLIDFNGHPAMGDHAVHAELAARLGGRVPLRHLAYTDDPFAVLRAVRGLRGLLAMRLHGAVFAYCAQTPCLMLAYHDKCRGWADMVGQPAAQVLDAAPCDPARLAAGLAQLAAAPALPALPLDDALARTRRNWTWAD